MISSAAYRDWHADVERALIAAKFEPDFFTHDELLYLYRTKSSMQKVVTLALNLVREHTPQEGARK